MRRLMCCALVACGSSSGPPSTTPPAPTEARGGTAAQQVAQREHDEQVEHEAITLAHRKIEIQQQDALGASCDEPAPASKHERCLPSCYRTEPADRRAAKKLTGDVRIEHVVCRRETALVLADELDAKLHARAFPRRFPAAHKKGRWQAAIESALHDKLPHGDAIVVAGSWRNLTHPLTQEKLRCVTVAHYTKLHHALDGCAGIGDVACEATGSAAARAINVVHYRLAEAKQLQAAGKTAECQQAALEAVAVSRGLPRWRQYAKLNVQRWKDNLAYRTRFDGTLDEDTLFATTAALGSEAEAVYSGCGGSTGAATTPEQEQSFHTCW